MGLGFGYPNHLTSALQVGYPDVTILVAVEHVEGLARARVPVRA